MGINNDNVGTEKSGAKPEKWNGDASGKNMWHKLHMRMQSAESLWIVLYQCMKMHESRLNSLSWNEERPYKDCGDLQTSNKMLTPIIALFLVHNDCFSAIQRLHDAQLLGGPSLAMTNSSIDGTLTDARPCTGLVSRSKLWSDNFIHPSHP